MQVGGPQVVVAAVVMVVPMVVMMIMVMVVVIAAQQPGADQVDDKPDAGDEHRLAEVDRHRGIEAQEAFPADQQSDHGEDDGAGETGEVAEFPRAEGEARVVAVAPGVKISQRGDQHRRRMGRHMPAVGNQRHRAEADAGYDFHHHHDRGERNHQPGAAFVAFMVFAQEDVVMRAGKPGSCHLRYILTTSISSAAPCARAGSSS